MLVWHCGLLPIDRGAALYFHHTWKDYLSRSRDRFPPIKDHVLLRFASTLEAANLKMTHRLAPDIIGNIVKLIPDIWLVGDSPFNDSNQYRDAYIEYLLNRLESPRIFLEEAISARSISV